MKTISIDILDSESIQKAIRDIEEYRLWLDKRAEVFIQRLADVGVATGSQKFSEAKYAGNNDTEVSEQKQGDKHYVVIARGTAVLFIEYGTGLQMGDHPERPEDFFPGSYGSGRGANEKGWMYQGELGGNPPSGTAYSTAKGAKERGLIHTYGNPANCCMYQTVKDIDDKVLQIAREVFA